MILVTGGTGFLGRHLLQALTDAEKSVRVMYRKKIPEDIPRDMVKKLDWQPGDVLDIESLEKAMEGVTHVFHCAGKVGFLPREKEELMQVNIEGTANVVNIALSRGIKKLLHVSSVAAIGRALTGRVIDENCKWEDSPNNAAYALSKYRGEMEVWRGIGEGLNAVIVNPSIILGAGNWDSGSASLIKNAYKEFPWYTGGVNGLVDARDVVKAMTRLMESDISGERFILNADNWYYKDLFTEMAKCLSKKPPSRYAAPWMGELVWRIEKIKSRFTGKVPLITKETARTAQLKVYYNSEKIRQFLPGFQFTPLKQTIEYTAAAFLKDLNSAKK